jgi:predicted kinase
MDALSINLWDEEERALIESLQWQIAQRALSLGLNVVMDFGFWSREERDRFRQGAKVVGARFELKFLDVPLEELWTRVQNRKAESPQIQRSDLERWWQAFEPPSPEELTSG